jgi:hypothetical protein
LEVIGDLVLESGGRVELPLGELLLQAIARDLAQRLQTRGGLEANREGETAALPLSGSGRRIRRMGGRKVPCGKERKNSSWWGLGSLLLLPERTESMNYGRGQATGKGREEQSSNSPPRFRLEVWMLPFSFLFSISLAPPFFLFFPLFVVELQPCRQAARVPELTRFSFFD